MADAATVHIGENSLEYVAYRLMLDVLRNEGHFVAAAKSQVPRKVILDTYAECLSAVQFPNSRVNAA